MSNLKYFEVGDVVYSNAFGQGCVKANNEAPDAPAFPLVVHFRNGDKVCTLTYDGRFFVDGPVAISKSPLPEIVNEPICPFKEGDLVWVRMREKDFWYLRFFCGLSLSEDFPYNTYSDGVYGGDIIKWVECEPYDPATVENYRMK